MGSGRVLILEDDQALASTYELLISELTPKRAVVSHSVAELHQHRDEALACDPALLDVNLGDGCLSGIDAFEWLREQKFSGRIYFITGHALSHPLVARAVATGGATVLRKPVEFERFLEVVSGDVNGSG